MPLSENVEETSSTNPEEGSGLQKYLHIDSASRSEVASRLTPRINSLIASLSEGFCAIPFQFALIPNKYFLPWSCASGS